MPLIVPQGVELPPARRLVVLVPDADLDEAALARRMWTLAAPSSLSVLFLGLVRSTPDEPGARRRLATLSALTRDDRVQVNTTLIVATDWFGALRPLLRRDDVIVCHAEQTLSGWRGVRPLANQLCQTLRVPVHALNGFYAGEPAQPVHPMRRLVFWGGAVVILAGAFLLQLQISALPKNWVEAAFMILSVVAECALIGLWSRVSAN